MTLIFILGFIILSMVVIYITPKLLYWTISLFVYLLIIRFISWQYINNEVFWVISLIYLILSCFNIKRIGRLLTKIIFLKAKKLLPKISETEKLALDSGDPWFEKEIFQGKPNFNTLHNTKKFQLSFEEQNFLDNETNELCSMLDDWKITNITRDLPVEVWNFLRNKGFFGLVILKKYGGKGFSAAAHSEIVLKIATRSNSAAVTVMVPNSLGPGELLHHYGTDEQKNYYLPRLAKGEEIPCFALTGPTAGSDATSMPDEGIVCYGEHKGQNVLGIKLRNINKRYITLAPIATLVGLAFKLKDPDGLLKDVGREGITCALLPYDHLNLEIGNRSLPLNQAFMNGPVRMKEGFIPIDWIIGGQKMAGEGWRMLVDCLSIGRSISLPACGTANSLLSVITTSAYAAIREQFKVPIGSFEGVEGILGKMGGLTYMTNATRQFTVSAVDNGIKPSVASAIAKYHITENGREILSDAMDIHGGRGIIMGPNNYLGNAFQGIPIGITVEGANIMTRNLLIFGQGAMRCHPFIREEYESLSMEYKEGLNTFSRAFYGHIGYFLQNMLRSVFNAYTAGIFAKGYNSKFNAYYKKITRLSSAFAIINDLSLIVLGGELKRKERLSARLGDTMSYLYMACSTLKYFKDNGEIKSDEIFLKWSLDYCLFNGQNAILEVLDNFPLPILAKFMKISLFPYGKPFKKSSDRLEHDISYNLLNDCLTRKAFKEECYIPNDANDIIGRVEIAYKAVLDTYLIKRKIHYAIKKKQLGKDSSYKLSKVALENGIINQEEMDKLNMASKYVDMVIQVDDFNPFEFGPKNAHPSWQ